MRALLFTLLLSLPLAAQTFTGATVTQADASGGVGPAVTAATRAGAQWVAWTVPYGGGGAICCWERGAKGCCGRCSLVTRDHGFSMNDDAAHHTAEMLVVLRLEGGRVSRLRLFDADCPVDAKGLTVHVLTGVAEKSSMDYLLSRLPDEDDEVVAAVAMHAHPDVVPVLERLTAASQPGDVREHALFWLGQRGGERGFRFLREFIRTNTDDELAEKAVFALSQSDASEATSELIALARGAKNSEVRRQAIFWLGQKAGEKAAAELRRSVDEDPDDDVKEHAVFAISQLPRERAVPMLIDLVRHHKSPNVREQAMFWLAQSGDDRALTLMEDILTH